MEKRCGVCDRLCFKPQDENHTGKWTLICRTCAQRIFDVASTSQDWFRRAIRKDDDSVYFDMTRTLTLDKTWDHYYQLVKADPSCSQCGNVHP